MKKTVLFIALFFLLATVSFISAEKNVLATGIHFNNQFPIGKVAEYTNFTFGLGWDTWFFFPDFLPEGNRAGIFTDIQWQIINSPLKEVSFVYSTEFTAGLFYRYTFKNSGFSLQPGIGYGAALHYLDSKKEYPFFPSGLYVDQLIEFSVSFVYSGTKEGKHPFELAVTPVYTLMPEYKNFFQLLGLRAGCMYKI